MRRGTTRTGFGYEFEEIVLDDFRFVDLLVEIQDDETKDFDRIAGVSKLLELLLGKEQKKALYAHIGAEYGGRVPLAAAQAELEDIMTGSEADGKN